MLKTKRRFNWLLLNLLTALLATWVISFFGASIEQMVALAFLMPIVASMGGNAGMQTLAVTIRAIAKKELSASNFNRVVGKEFISPDYYKVSYFLLKISYLRPFDLIVK